MKLERRTFLLDLDGTMYKGNQPCPYAIEFIDHLIANNIPFYFLTNNSSRTKKQNVKHMSAMGFQGIEPYHFFTSAMGAALYVKKKSEQKKAWLIGEEGLEEALLDQDFQLVKDNEEADFVFVGMDQTATYTKYSMAVKKLLQGATLIGTNPDRILMKEDGAHLGNGSIVSMLEYATKQTSPKLGKPHAAMLEEALSYFGLQKEECYMVGDNLETDIAFGVNGGLETIFVTSGVHTKHDIEILQIHPTYQISSLQELC